MNEREVFELRQRRHLALFRIAAEVVNGRAPNADFLIPEARIASHDASKFSEEEFLGYIEKYVLGNDGELWHRAWEHHWRNNSHHWQHWQLEEGFVSMPETFLTEMTADWMAASRQYTGSWNMVAWLDEKLGGTSPKIPLGPTTRERLYTLLERLGYMTGMYNCNLFAVGRGYQDIVKWLEARVAQKFPPGALKNGGE